MIFCESGLLRVMRVWCKNFRSSGAGPKGFVFYFEF